MSMSVGPIGSTELSGTAYRGGPEDFKKKDIALRYSVSHHDDATMTKPTNKVDVKLGDYRALAEFRYELRRYLALSDHAARSVGLHPGQYRLLLMLKGLPDGIEPTIGNLAERLGLRHHSTVELVDRLEKRGLIHRERNERHRSFVFVRISPKGESILRRIVASRKVDLKKAGPILVKALNTLTTRRS